MSTFLSESLPEQPAFLYATYGPTATASASSTAAGYVAADVIQADENNGWKPAVLTTVTLTIDFGTTRLCDHFAMAGNEFAGATVAVYGPDGVLFAATEMTATGEFWGKFANTSTPYLVIHISGHSSAFQIKHVTCGMLAPLPFMEDGFCPNPIQAEGQHLVSYAGLFLGSVTQRVIRPFTIPFGQVDAVEEIAFSNWKAACVETAQGFFFVPDIASAECFFGYVDKKWKYEPTIKMGMATIPKIPFTARVR